MLMRSTPYLATSVLALLLACGGSDGRHRSTGDGKPVEEPPPGGDPPVTPGTFVLTNTLPYAVPELASCARAGERYGLMPTLDTLAVDGDLGEWAAIKPAVDDPLGDAPAAADFGAVSAARVGPDLALAVVMARGAGVGLNVELGGMRVSPSVILSEAKDLPAPPTVESSLRRSFRYDGSALFEATAAGWLAVDPLLWSAVTGATGVELRLSERLLGDTLAWPTFWLKVHTDEASVVRDASAAVVFASVLTGPTVFTLTGCQQWEGQTAPFHLRLFTAPGSEQLSRHAVEPRDRVYEWAFALTRSAYDATSRTFGGLRLPVSESTVFVMMSDLTSLASSDVVARPDRAFDGLVLDGRSLVAASLDPHPEHPVFEAAAQHFARLEALARFPEAPTALTDALARALADRVVRETLGLSFWLDRLKSRPASDGFGTLLGATFDAKLLLAAWSAAATHARAGNAPGDALALGLAAVAPDDALRAAAAAIVAGWATSAPFDPAFAPEWLDDTDEDGLPNFLERQIGTDPNVADTDKDGWTDYGELVAGTEPLAGTRMPTAIVPDGSFGDWLALMPKRVIIDRGQTGACPKAADISHYAAVASADDLVIGAYATDFLEDEPRARWEAVIDLPAQQRQLVVTTISGDRVTEIKDGATGTPLLRRERAVAQGRGTVEWSLSRADLGLQPWTVDRSGLRIRLRTVYHDGTAEQFCDETAWYAPQFNQ